MLYSAQNLPRGTAVGAQNGQPLWKVAAEAQFDCFIDSFQDKMQRRIPETFEEVLNIFFQHYVMSMKPDKRKVNVFCRF